MKFEGVVEIAVPREQVWQSAMDPQVMARVIPGVRSMEVLAPNEYRAQMKVGVGALNGTFIGTVKLSELTPPSDCFLTVHGRGSIGEFSGTGTVQLQEVDTKTMVHYHADMRLGGPMAGLGEGLMRTITNTLITQTAKVFTQICNEQGHEAET